MNPRQNLSRLHLRQRLYSTMDVSAEHNELRHMCAHGAAFEEPHALGEESCGDKIEKASRDYQEHVDRRKVPSSIDR